MTSVTENKVALMGSDAATTLTSQHKPKYKFPPLVIAYCGKRRAGKNTSADYMVSKYGGTQYAFADLLKNICMVNSGLPREVFYDEVLKDKYNNDLRATPRQYMQDWGDVFRNDLQKYKSMSWYGDKRFVDKVDEDIKKQILKCEKAGHRAVIHITDLRYPNEADMLVNNYDAKIIKIVRSDTDTDTKILTSAHSSETEPDKIKADFNIDNSGTTLQDLYSALDKQVVSVIK